MKNSNRNETEQSMPKSSKRDKRKSFYQKQNQKGSSSKGQLFTQERKYKTIQSFHKSFKGAYQTAENPEGTRTSNLSFSERRPAKDDNSIWGKRQRLEEARLKYEQVKRDKQEAREKQVEERGLKQQAWKTKKKEKAKINRLITQKTSKGQPNMKALSKALLLKIQQKYTVSK